MNGKAFIDLNIYRLTPVMLADIDEHIQSKCTSVEYHYYNYSPTLHKSLAPKGKLYPLQSGRRKTLIDMRVACDMIEYASKSIDCNIFMLVGLVDSENVFAKLHQLKARTTLFTMQNVTVNVDVCQLISRSNGNNTTIAKSMSNLAVPTLTTTASKGDYAPTNNGNNTVIPAPSADHLIGKKVKSIVSVSPQSHDGDAKSTISVSTPNPESEQFEYDEKLSQLNRIINRLRY